MLDPNIRSRRRMTRVQVVRWGVDNFKSIENASFDLRRLSVLVGANSAGKSSLIQSILLLAQCTNESQLTLNGPVVSLGEAIDVVRTDQKVVTVKAAVSIPNNSSSDQPVEVVISIDLVINHGDLIVQSLSLRDATDVLFEAVRDTRASRTYSSELRRGDSLGLVDVGSPANFLRVSHIRGLKRHGLMFIQMAGLLPEAIYLRKTMHQKRRDAEILLKTAQAGEPPRELLYLITQQRITVDLFPVIRRFREANPSILRGTSFNKLLKELSSDELLHLKDEIVKAMPNWEAEPLARPTLGLRGSGRLMFARRVERDATYSAPFEYLTSCTVALENFAQSIRYLGPLRDEPRVVYPMGRGSRPVPVGSHGEFTADLLSRMRSRSIEYTDPFGEPQFGPLLEAVSIWVEYLGIGTRISVSDRGKLGRTIRLEKDGTDRDLTTIGVGASQLLPVVVTLLAVEEGTLILFEQPELHLHPAVQSRLGDFLATARQDIRLVVETHSESLINRLRLRVVEQRLDPTEIGIYFGEQKQGITKFRCLELNEYGDLNEWPTGFFDEGSRDAAKLVKVITQRLSSK